MPPSGHGAGPTTWGRLLGADYFGGASRSSILTSTAATRNWVRSVIAEITLWRTVSASSARFPTGRGGEGQGHRDRPVVDLMDLDAVGAAAYH